MLKLLSPVACLLLHAAIVNVHGLGTSILSPADVYIEYIGAIYTDASCSNIEEESVQNIQAIKWTLSKLNDINYIPNVKIGLRVSQTCRQEGKAEGLALKLSTEMLNATEARVVGIIGSDYSSESESISRLISSLPEEYRLLQLAYSATSSSLRNKEIHKNFFRTIPPDDIQVEVMVKFMEALNWTYMAIVYDDDSYGRGGKDQLIANTRGRDVCFPTLIPVDTAYQNLAQLEAEISDKIIGTDVPVNGIIVFGSSVLADIVLTAAENVLEKNPDAPRPVFLFSEAGGYIQGHHTNISRGAFVLSPPRRIISDFQQEWKNIFLSTPKLYEEVKTNDWLRDVYNTKFNCTLAQTIDQNTCGSISETEFNKQIPESVYNQYAIQAAMVMARSVRDVYIRKCPSRAGVCPVFLDIQDTPRNEFIDELIQIPDINLDSFGNFRLMEFQNPDLILSFGNSTEVTLPEEFPIYEVYSHQSCTTGTSSPCLVKVADYKRSKELAVTFENIKDYGINGEELSWPNIRKAQCPDGSLCQTCFEKLVEDSVLYVPGDLYVVGIAPVHNTGSTPLQCGDIKKGGLDIVETILFAVGEAKTKPAGKIGTIIIDSCNDPQIIQEKILTLHRLGVYINGQYIYVGDKILGYVGGWSSDVSKAVADITSRLRYPQISYASTAAVLSKRSLYPYFLRVPSPDDKQAETILRIVKELGGNFIQILHSDSAYGEGGRDIMLNLIESSTFEFCVAQVLPVSTSSDKGAILSNLRNFPQAKIVVLFLGSFEIEHVIDAFNTLEKNEFLFISSEGLGTRLDVSPYKNMIGSITVTSQLTINEKLKDHMKNLRPDSSSVNPWIRAYLENQFNCYFEWSYDKTSNRQCRGDETLDVYTTDFRLDSWTPFAERAVTALLAGTESILMDKCNGVTTEICDSYRNSTDQVYEAIKNVKLQGNSGFDARIFNSGGDGTAGYQIYVIALDQDGQYKKVGDSSLGVNDDPVVLTFQTSLFNSVRGAAVNSSCSGNSETCRQCFPSTPAPESADDLPVGFIVVIVILVVICCILAGVLLFICNRHGCCIKIENGKPKFTNTYLTPVYAKERKAHGVDGSDFPIQDNYDSIGVSYNQSQASSYFGRTPTTDGSAGSSERTTSGGSRGRRAIGMDGSGGNVSGPAVGSDNLAFENENVSGGDRIISRQGSNSGFDSNVRGNSYLIPESQPEAHRFIKPTPAPKLPPARKPEVVFQPDGSYITAAASESEFNISGGSAVSTQTDTNLSQDSGKSVGYLRSVQTAEDNQL